MKTTAVTPEPVLKELVHIFLVISWLFERDAKDITEISKDQHRLYFRPFWEAIGFAPNPEKLDLKKSAPCRVPVGMYVLRFLMGYIGLPFQETPQILAGKQAFQNMLSDDLKKILTSQFLTTHFPSGEERLLSTEPAYPAIRLVWDFIQVSRKCSTIAPFKKNEAIRNKPVMSPNPLRIAAIRSSLSLQQQEYLIVARGLYEAHMSLCDWNPNLGLGLVVRSLRQ